MSDTTWISCADTAKLIRRALKREFPGIKFSVRSSTYSMGASINVKWTDGPTNAQLEPVAKAYSGASFDPMIDLKSYHTSELTYADDPARDGEPVHFGADFVFCERGYSETFARAIRDYQAARFSHLLADWPQVRADYRAWSLDWDDPHANDDLFGHSGPCCSPRDLFYRLSRITSADDLATLDAISSQTAGL